MGFGEGFDLGSPDPDAAPAPATEVLGSEEGFFPVVDSHRDFRCEAEGAGLLEEGFGGLPPAILFEFSDAATECLVFGRVERDYQLYVEGEKKIPVKRKKVIYMKIICPIVSNLYL